VCESVLALQALFPFRDWSVAVNSHFLRLAIIACLYVLSLHVTASAAEYASILRVPNQEGQTLNVDFGKAEVELPTVYLRSQFEEL
jgi:hypothetical protein